MQEQGIWCCRFDRGGFRLKGKRKFKELEAVSAGGVKDLAYE